LLEAMGALWVHGVAVAWDRQFAATGRHVALPTYAWQRERYWVELPDAASESTARRAHTGARALLGELQTIATQAGMRVWETSLALDRLPWMRDHRVQDAAVLPGAAYLDMALGAGRELFGASPFEVRDVRMVQVLSVGDGASVPVQLVANDDQGGRFRFQVASRPGGESWQTHATGALRRADDAATAERVAIDELRRRLTTALPPAGVYAAMAAAGMQYGPAFQGMTELWRGDGEALGRVRLPDAAGSAKAYALHPALLDSCFHVMSGVFPDAGGNARPWLPVEVGALRVFQPATGELWCHAKIASEAPNDADRRQVDLRIADDRGVVVVELRGLVVQQLAAAPQRREEDDWFLSADWERAALPPATVAAGRWLLVGARDGLGARLGAQLRDRGHAVAQLASGLDGGASRAALAEAFGGSAPTAVVHLGSLEVALELDAAAVDAALVHGCDSALALVQTLAGMGYRDAPRLWLVTRGSQAVDGGDVSAAQAPLLGLGRVIALEYADLRCARIDLDRAAPASELDALIGELLADDAEEEVAWRAGERFVARFDRRLPDGARREHVEPAHGRPFRLELDEPGVLDRMAPRLCERGAPGPGEVEIAVEAAALNFADVMQAMGFAFTGPSGQLSLGAECAGRVVAVGPGVERFRVGDDVVAFAPRSFASHVAIHELLVAPRPPALSPAQAAALPVVMMTAWHGLVHVARLCAGERVLIHSATGGTGQAAMQIARHLGAEIFATAGSPDKRAWLRAQGVAHVMDSRSLEFSEQVLAATGGQGVDVVFNSLSGAAIEASLAALAPDGRFIEIGKRDIFADRPLNLGQFKKAISYSHVDLAGLTMRRPTQVSALLREVVTLLAQGVLQPIEVEQFPIAQASDAFYKMAQARHTGKLVLTVDGEATAIRVPDHTAVEIRGDRTYLITGGLGGLGLSIARWLAERGAGQLVLMGRSGAANPTQQAAIAAIAAAGTEVVIARADVADRAQVEAALRAIPAARPLAGVVHAAGLLDDGVLAKQDPSRFRKVMAPKIQGALHLHELTRDARLDFFVMYSSAAGLMGSPGQGNYAAANCFLDALAHHRRAHGLAGLSVNWTAFSEVGLAAAQDNRGARIESQGMRSLTPAQGISVLARLLDSGCTQMGVVPLNLRQWLEFFPAAASARTLVRLVSAYRAGATRPSGDPEVVRRLAEAPPGKRAAVIEDVLSKLVSQVLRIPQAKVAAKEPLTGLGMDSLMGLELRNRIEATLGVTMPATLLWTYPTVAALSQHLAKGADDAAAVSVAADADAEPKADSAGMSASEAALLIDEEFEVLQ
ncbi:MAG TPA: SDR family NAD(P)-dependent oxidoreductase, partial [Kofleriaceae bacterium]|nr:SDR family NAD(P)-dependent oxidoreductase [Kofleriaceae bacterium]